MEFLRPILIWVFDYFIGLLIGVERYYLMTLLFFLLIWLGLIFIAFYRAYRLSAGGSLIEFRRFFLVRAMKYSFIWMKYIFLFLVFIFSLWSAIIIASIVYGLIVDKSCIQFPNGLLMEKRFFSNFQSYPTFKLPDGRLLLGEDDYVYRLSFSESTIYGIAGPRRRLHDGKEGQTYDFAYRPDIGLVKVGEDPDGYKRLKGDAGELISLPAHKAGLETHLTSEYWNMWQVYDLLKEDSAYYRDVCPLNIFP